MKRIAVVIFICLCFSLFADSSSKMLEEWNKLSEDEQWLCLLSEPFLSPKKMSLTTVNPEPKNNGRNSKKILENSWKLHSKEDVLDIVEKFKNNEWGFSPSYIESKNFYEKYPDSSIDEIATIECLELYQIMDLWFYAENKEKMGEHGFLALDVMRILSVIRWSVAAGWFSETEAVETAKPLMEQILDAYDSWEDYTCHFALGWCYYDLCWIYDLEKCQKELSAEIKKYDGSTKQNISHDIKFSAKNRNGSRILTYADAIYTPGEEASKWYLLRKCYDLGIKPLSYAEKEQYKAVRKEKANIPILAYWNLLTASDYNNIDVYVEPFEKCKVRTDLYHRFYMYYGIDLLESNQTEKVLSVLEKLDKEKSYYYLKSYYKFYKLVDFLKEDISIANIEYITSNTEATAKEILEDLEIAKKEFPVYGELKDIVSEVDLAMKYYLFEIYARCTDVYYEARDLENAVLYMKKADEYLELFNKCDSKFKSSLNIRKEEQKLNEIRAFINSRYKNKKDEGNTKKKNEYIPNLNAV